MIRVSIHTVPVLQKAIRLQDYGVGIFYERPTKSGLKKAIKNKLVYVNKKVASTGLYIRGGETIELFEKDRHSKPFHFPLEVIYEDDYLAIINKPAGILVSGNSFATIYNALPLHITKSTQPDAIRSKPVHRLDYPTSGLLLIGKTNQSVIALHRLFEERKIKKVYHAITIGTLADSGLISTPIDSKQAVTQYNILRSVASDRFGCLNLVQLRPKTGRKHQLRKHLFNNGSPILGDRTYFQDNLLLTGHGLYLHASSLEFKHPITNVLISVTQALPKKFNTIFSST